VTPLTITVLGTPVAKARPRMTRSGIAFTPAKTRSYETYVRLVAQEEMKAARIGMMEGPLRMTMRVDLPIPSSWSKRKQQQAITGEIRPCTRPDIDNFIKAAMDACNGIVFSDDSQVVRLEASKRYALQPKLVLTVAPEEAAV